MEKVYLNIDSIEDEKEKKRRYVELWEQTKRENPDMPLRENYPKGKSGNNKYRKEKDEWLKTKIALGEYIKKRELELPPDLANLYKAYPKWLRKTQQE